MDETSIRNEDEFSNRSISPMSEHEFRMIEIDQIVEPTQSQNMNQSGAEGYKRPRDDEENEEELQWETVTKKKEKRYKPSGIIELYISCNDKLPKQFAFAKLLKLYEITDVVKVKYINPYKIRIDLNNELMTDRLETCKEFIEKGWKFQRAMEQTYSYGVLKNVDLELPDQEILESITCPAPAKLASVYRLQWRSEKEWLPSESVRLCFQGTYLPGFVYVDGLKIKIDPYIFPVSQCSRCWKLGHTAKKCTGNKIVCPKCSGNHPNCDTQIFTCVNCSGSHISLSKMCPKYLKEKRLRELMAEFNCTYRKAMTMYVEPEKTEQKRAEEKQKYEPPPPTSTAENSFPSNERSFADILRNKPAPQSSSKKPSKKQSFGKQADNSEYAFNFKYQTPPSFDSNIPPSQDKPIKFTELLIKLKEILFLREVSIKNKLLNILKCFIKWLILVVASNLEDWPLLDKILNFFNG